MVGETQNRRVGFHNLG